jgi:hypothetical protein
VCDAQRVWRETGPLPEQPDQPELADARSGGELVEPDVAFGPVSSMARSPRWWTIPGGIGVVSCLGWSTPVKH